MGIATVDMDGPNCKEPLTSEVMGRVATTGDPCTGEGLLLLCAAGVAPCWRGSSRVGCDCELLSDIGS